MALQPNEQINIDSLQDNGFVSFYRSLPEKPSTTIRIFDRSDYYTVHGEDALFTAKELYKTTAGVKYYGSDPKIPSVVLNKANFEVWIRELLLIRQYRIEIYQNKGTGKNKNDWVLEQKASPGNLADFEELQFITGVDSTNLVGIMAVKLGSEVETRVIGVAYVDAASRKILVSEFVDRDGFSNLEAILVQLGPKECLLPLSDKEYGQVKEVLKRNNVLISEIKKSEFQNRDVVQDLNRLLRLEKGMENCLHLPELNKKHSMAALAALIKFLELLSEEAALGQYKLNTFDTKQFMRLDAAAVDALQINPSVQDTNKLQHLQGLFNNCRTGQGQRLLSQWMRQPLMDLNKIEERQNLVGVFVNDSQIRQMLHNDFLRKIPDFQKLAKRFARNTANLQDCYRMYQALLLLPQLVEELETLTSDHLHLIRENFCNPIKVLLFDFVNFREMIERTLDLSMVENNEFVVKVEFDEELAELREKILDFEESMKHLLGKAARELGFEAGKTIKLDSIAQLGYFFRVTLKEEKSLRGNCNYKIIDANKGGVRFQSSQLKEANDEYVACKEQYDSIQKKVVVEIVKIAAGYSTPMLQLSDVVAELDVVLSLAVTATGMTSIYVKPKILPKGSGILKLVQARHPCMELLEGINYIPNDAVFDQNTRFHIITGPNMGGKSTYMRMVGVIVLLAQIGSYVPCESAVVSIVDAILTRVGCEDSQTRAISTFMLEMVEMATILKNATKDSLLIIDELGRGTSTYDGFGLAWAIAEKISKEIKSFCMFATHFHELTLLADEVECVKNLHVEAIVGENGPTFLYRVKNGICDRSYGLHVAELVQFPEKVLLFAKEKAKELEDFQGGSFSEFGGDDEASVKKRQKSKKEGEKIILDFLHKVKQLDVHGLSSKELNDALEKLKCDVSAKNNPYVQSILNKFS